VIDNPRKVGFNAPLFDYLDARSNIVRQELLSDALIFDIVRRDAIERLLERPELPNSQSKFLFNFVNARIFLEELAGCTCADPATSPIHGSIKSSAQTASATLAATIAASR